MLGERSITKKEKQRNLNGTEAKSVCQLERSAPSIDPRQRGLVMAVLLLGSFTALMAETFLNNALPAIMAGVRCKSDQCAVADYSLFAGCWFDDTYIGLGF